MQIASLLKDNERIQSTQTVTPNDEDSDIKKIKKVCSIILGGTTAPAPAENLLTQPREWQCPPPVPLPQGIPPSPQLQTQNHQPPTPGERPVRPSLLVVPVRKVAQPISQIRKLRLQERKDKNPGRGTLS